VVTLASWGLSMHDLSSRAGRLMLPVTVTTAPLERIWRGPNYRAAH
jgi:hypothetical protein